MTPFGREAAQGVPHAPPGRRGSRSSMTAADNGPGDSTPAAAFGWTGLDERAQSSDGGGGGGINRWWVAFDARYMQPVFGGPQPAQDRGAGSLLDAVLGASPRSPYNARHPL
jgi:hypothetical protein